MKMLKLISVISLTLLIIGFFLYLYLDAQGVFRTKEEKYFYKKLKEFEESKKDNISLIEITNFEWNYVCAVSSYNEERPKSFYEKVVGFKIAENVPTSYGSSDGDILLLFIKKQGRQLLKIRADQLIIYKAKKICVTKETAVLRLSKTEYYKQRFSKFEHQFILE